ncbi:MAG TPA: hypothetical protein PLD30_05075, partial [Candidatus Competibacteraceae bacterium]|nr:hypothetical protein [Candidatus Competibacteraceae bacterium]
SWEASLCRQVVFINHGLKHGIGGQYSQDDPINDFHCSRVAERSNFFVETGDDRRRLLIWSLPRGQQVLMLE